MNYPYKKSKTETGVYFIFLVKRKSSEFYGVS